MSDEQPPAHAATLASDTRVAAIPVTTVRGDALADTAAGVAVLPRTPDRPVESPNVRYEAVRRLGMGGMGEVDLVQDNDIGRRVAVKRLLHGPQEADGFGRFVEEIRTTGRLEHPNIVPIHDVGVDSAGRYFFVMKYVEGETLEAIITKLGEGEPVYVKKYSFEARIQIFMGLLRALQFAHQHGIIHRDLKPANIMVGACGEVMLMDWGIAKPLRHGEPASPASLPAAGEETRERLYTTRHGSLIGTPAYMSPEQASGRNDLTDERSDTYSATVVFFELLFLRHYLSDRTTLASMLAGVLDEEYGSIRAASQRHPKQGYVPAELSHFVVRGMRKDPALRWQTATRMLEELEAILEGRVTIQCHVTFTKRITRELGRFVDRHPMLGFTILMSCFAAVVFALVRVVFLH